MQLSKLRFSMTVLCIFLFAVLSATAEAGSDSVLFREYIGSDFKQVKFSDIPIHSDIDFHFILSFAIDYTTEFKSPSPTDGKFNIFWDKDNLSPSEVHQIKNHNRNVKVALSLGGDSVGDGKVYFTPDSIDSWVKNAVSTLTEIIEEFDLDGIDIDYEHFHSDPNTFAECIGQLVTILKKKRIISFASIAPFDDEEVQSHYQALWKKYGSVFDFVNFQFYAYDEGTSVPEFLEFFDQQTSNYEGGKILVSVISDQSGGLIPDHGFFTACKMLQKLGKLEGIFIWSADDSKEIGFRFEKQSQALLARSH